VLLKRMSKESATICALMGLSLVVAACGSRSILQKGEVEPACESDSECDRSNLCEPQSCIDGVCEVVDAVVCGPARECFSVACNPASGACEETPLTEDRDGDGARAPLVGYAPGSIGSCGGDCDDNNPFAYPGGVEVCDGADNDCDGIIDNGSSYLGLDEGEIPRIVSVASQGRDGSGRRGATFGDGVFGVGFWARSDITVSYIAGLNSQGEFVFPETPVSNVNAPSFGPDVAWSGDSFGATWSDPRVDNNYEVYFARFDSWGTKLGPDVRVTNAERFSIHPRIIFDQGRYLIVWDDWRDEPVTGATKVYAQLLDRDGNLIGENVQLSDDSESAEYPQIAATNERFAVVYTSLGDQTVTLRARTFDKITLEPSSLALLSDTDVRAPRVEAVGRFFVITWEIFDVGPGPSIMGAVINENGNLVAGPRPLTTGATFARTHDTVSLGNRFALLWADDYYGNYELSAAVLDLGLNELEPRRRLTENEYDTIGVEAALGDGGRIGVLFDDWRSGTHHAYFLSLGCGEMPASR
jgi:hypothetical protein